MKIMKGMAIAILTTMISGLLAWAGSTISQHGRDIAKLQAHRQTLHQDVKVIKQDVKHILEKL